MLSDSGESSALGTAGWDICSHCQRHTSQSHGPCHYRHCRRKESRYFFFWSQTGRYRVQSWGNCLLTVMLFFYIFNDNLIDLLIQVQLWSSRQRWLDMQAGPWPSCTQNKWISSSYCGLRIFKDNIPAVWKQSAHVAKIILVFITMSLGIYWNG